MFFVVVFCFFESKIGLSMVEDIGVDVLVVLDVEVDSDNDVILVEDMGSEFYVFKFYVFLFMMYIY